MVTIKNHVNEYVTELFHENDKSSSYDWHLVNHSQLIKDDKATLKGTPSNKDILEALGSTGSIKALGTDGFKASFIKNIGYCGAFGL